MTMMNSRLTAQLSRYTKEKIYVDKGYLIKSVKTGVNDSRGHPVVNTVEVPLECSFTDKASREIWKDILDLEEIEGEVRFVSQTAPDKSDQFKLTERFGSNVSDRVFEIVGIKNRDAFGFVCALKAVKL